MQLCAHPYSAKRSVGPNLCGCWVWTTTHTAARNALLELRRLSKSHTETTDSQLVSRLAGD